jgi:hypothetical protein
LAIQNGKRYKSKYAAFQVLVRSQRDVWNQSGDVLLDTIPPLTAEFATHLGEFSFSNPLTGSQDVGADIRGHFFDSAQQATDKGWSQEEHDMVVTVLDKECAKNPEAVWEFVVAVPTAPWPKYDATNHNQIAGLADQLGLAAEALAYEQATKARPSVVEKLTELLAPAAEDALTAS